MLLEVRITNLSPMELPEFPTSLPGESHLISVTRSPVAVDLVPVSRNLTALLAATPTHVLKPIPVSPEFALEAILLFVVLLTNVMLSELVT